jgi:hypothetical protein
MDVGSWSGLDESGPDKLGVGLFFQTNPTDGYGSYVPLCRRAPFHAIAHVVSASNLFMDASTREPTLSTRGKHVHECTLCENEAVCDVLDLIAPVMLCACAYPMLPSWPTSCQRTSA